MTARGVALRLTLLVGVVAGVWLVSDWAMRAQAALPPDGPLLAWPVLVLLAIYALLLALPFVPGIEIGLALLAMHGAAAAPFVYGATVAGLMLSYGAGCLIPASAMAAGLHRLGRPGAASALQDWSTLPRPDRLTALSARLPGWLGARIGTLRFVLLAALFNLPGNAVLGGGGGIALLAGLSRLYPPGATALTVAVAVAPVPLAVWIWGGAPLGLM
ncbi:MAG: hypothetical protein MUF73_08620 [Rhodobacteraceae bacterium]|jgi:hypothetical protein|nr:hypothetical protein [Paracoccaceae bacterium]